MLVGGARRCNIAHSGWEPTDQMHSRLALLNLEQNASEAPGTVAFLFFYYQLAEVTQKTLDLVTYSLLRYSIL